MKKFRIPPCKNHSLSPMVAQNGSATAPPDVYARSNRTTFLQDVQGVFR